MHHIIVWKRRIGLVLSMEWWVSLLPGLLPMSIIAILIWAFFAGRIE